MTYLVSEKNVCSFQLKKSNKAVTIVGVLTCFVAIAIQERSRYDP